MAHKEDILPGAAKTTIAAALGSVYCPVYDGSRSFRDFVDKFNIFTNALGLVIPERITILPLLLRNPAAEDAYKSLPENLRLLGPWNELIDKLAERICPVYSQDPALRRLQSTVQGDLSVDAFAHSLRQQSLAAFSHNDPVKDQTLRLTFLRGLKPAIKSNVLRGKPTDFVEAIELARMEESIQSQSLDPQEMLVNAVNNLLRPHIPRSNPHFRNDPTSDRNLNQGSRTRKHSYSTPRIPQRNANWHQPNRFRENRFQPKQVSWQGPSYSRQEPTESYHQEQDSYTFRTRDQSNSSRRNANRRTTRQVNNILCTPFMLSITLICLCLIGQIDATYQTCTRAKGGVLLLPPRSRKCSIQEPEHVLETKIHLFTPNTTAQEWDAWRCTRERHNICIKDLLFLRDTNRTVSKVEPISTEDCNIIVRDRKINDTVFSIVQHDIYATPEPEFNPSRSWSQSICEDKPRIVLERCIMTRMSDDSIISDLLLNTEGCLAHHGNCQSNTSMVIWTPQHYEQHCDYLDLSIYEAVIGDNIILIPNSQTALVLKTEEVPHAIRRCFDTPVFHTTSGSFITLPEFPGDNDLHALLEREFKKKQKKVAKRSITSCDFPLDIPWIQTQVDYESATLSICPYLYLRPIMSNPGIAQIWQLIKKRRTIEPSYSIIYFAKAHRDKMNFIMKTEITALGLKSFLENNDYTDPEEALVQYLGRKELYAATRANLKFLNSQQLLEQIGQRMNATDFDLQMLTVPGYTYREKAETIARTLAFSPTSLSRIVTVPSTDEVLQAFMQAKPPKKTSEKVNENLLDQVRNLAKELLALKKQKFNSELANLDDAKFANLSMTPDEVNLQILHHKIELKDETPYSLTSSTKPDLFSRKLLLKVFLPLLDNPQEPMRNSIRIHPELLIRPTDTPTSTTQSTTHTRITSSTSTYFKLVVCAEQLCSARENQLKSIILHWKSSSTDSVPHPMFVKPPESQFRVSR